MEGGDIGNTLQGLGHPIRVPDIDGITIDLRYHDVDIWLERLSDLGLIGGEVATLAIAVLGQTDRNPTLTHGEHIMMTHLARDH